MTYDTVMLYLGLAGVAFVWVRHIARMERSRQSHAERTEALIRAARPPMPAPPPSKARDYPDGTGQMISRGRDGYGQVIESVRINGGQRAPTMPRPAREQRCQWCLVKLTNGECVDGCGGHQ